MPNKNNMTYLKLVQLLSDLLVRLNMKHFEPAIHSDDVAKYDALCDKLAGYLRMIVREEVRDDTEDFIWNANALRRVNEDLLVTLSQEGQFADTLDMLVDCLGVVEELLNITEESPDFDSLFPQSEEKPLFEAGDIPSEKDVPSEEAEAVPLTAIKYAVEEVLYGVELTPESLIVTVATGGCTEKGSFHIHIDKGYTGLPPYQVTVYRVKPDEGKGDFEPIRISFSRKELGLQGIIDFYVRNRIGNTSRHRLML